jgi:extracellular factor (EF) 3-hydroxypalmitic acid methyl ester biosynthesis protein
MLRTTGLVGAENRFWSSELWKTVGSLMERGWLLTRARYKPRGYAGDHELLGRMYGNNLCDDPLGRHLDRYFQEDAAPIAVRNRMRMMADWIVQGVRERVAAGTAERRSVRIAMVGSAFGMEVRDALEQLTPHERKSVALTLLDLDPAAVESAAALVAPLLPPDSLTTASGSILKLPVRRKLAEPLQGADLLFCPGIFDYLSDDEAADMLRLFYGALARGGHMTVFQFAPHNPSRALMEWIGNWYLIYRDDSQFRRVAASAGLPAAATAFGAEPFGVDLFVTVDKP